MGPPKRVTGNNSILHKALHYIGRMVTTQVYFFKWLHGVSVMLLLLLQNHFDWVKHFTVMININLFNFKCVLVLKQTVKTYDEHKVKQMHNKKYKTSLEIIHQD